MLTAHIRIAGVDLQFTAWQIDRLGGADIKLLLRQLDKGQTAEIHRANDLGGAGARAAIAWRCASEVVDHLHFREGALFIFPIGKASTRGNFHPLPWHSDDLQFDAPDPRIPVVLEIFRDTGRTKGIDDRLHIGLPGMEDGKVRPKALVKASRFPAAFHILDLLWCECRSSRAGAKVPSASLRGSSRNGVQENVVRSEEPTSELQSLMRISYAVFFLKKKINSKN